jgi:hypothetical protein
MNDPSQVSPFPEDELPAMTHKEASWHEHVASIHATSTPLDPARDSRDLAAAALPGTTLSGIYFPPTSAGCLMAVQGAERLGLTPNTADEVATLIYCMAKGEEAFDLVEAGDLETIVKRARQLVKSVPLREMKGLLQWCMATLNADADGAEKKPGPPQGPAVDPTQAATPRPPL